MSAEIHIFPGVTTLDIPPERVLQSAIDNEIRDVVLLGFDKNGELYVATSIGSDFAKINLMIDRAKHNMLTWFEGQQ